MSRSTPRATTTGLGRVLVALYATFAVAAVSRAGVQIATRFHEAPLAYLLSAFAGLVYVLATLGLAMTGERWRRMAWGACSVELVGVLTVGVLSIFDAQAFPDSTVWSGFGRGYLYIPLVLPVLGLVYLRRESRRPR
ncbi:hypothetical protein ACFFKU_02065 [Kineococcus gynurae]|uniref:Integral membrane protein n=1 Tax=Kineococcus gynurae TaxID=452979 RepID=A0ABV5LST4_9ACTN